jgi:hypothetical protein
MSSPDLPDVHWLPARHALHGIDALLSWRESRANVGLL